MSFIWVKRREVKIGPNKNHLNLTNGDAEKTEIISE